MLNIPLRLYYPAKRFLPRRLQLALRRSLLAHKLRKHNALWPINPAAAAPPPGWTGWPEGKRFALVLTHDVESQRGVDRVLQLADLEESLGFRSSFNFVAEDYPVPSSLRAELERRGFEVGLHGLTHDGSLYHSRREFLQQATRINQVLKDWKAAGFRSPSMFHNLEWLHDLEIEYDASTFDTDPFEPQPDALGTIFPMFIPNPGDGGGYVELPYTLPQDFHLFVLMRENSIDIWKRKLRWLAENGGVALCTTHPDYMAFGNAPGACDEYPVQRYTAFLEHIARTYGGTFWHPLPRELARFWKLRYPVEPIIQSAPGPDNHEDEMTMTLDRKRQPVSGTHGTKRAAMVAYTFYETDFRVRRYVEALVAEGYEVDVFALRSDQQNKTSLLDGARIYHLQERPYDEKGLMSFVSRMTSFSFKVFAILTLKHIFYKYDMIHIHNPPDFLVFSALVPRIMGAAIVFDMHENLPELYCAKFNKEPSATSVRLLCLFEKIATMFADYTIVAHDLLKERVVKRDNISEDKCLALLNYPSKQLFKPSPKKHHGDFRLIYPGTISYQHGIDIAVKAMAIVHQEHKAIRFDIYGKLNSSAYYQQLQDLIHHLNLDETIVFHGVVPLEAMGRKFASASIGVVPKRGGIFGSEAFSTKILEFMAAGLPVVASRTKIDEHYFNDTMVMFFEPDDHHDLAKCILELYHDPDKREMLAMNALEYTAENNWEVKSKVYLELVNTLRVRP